MNPRAATNDLLPFQGSPFSHLGTSAFMAESHSFKESDIQFTAFKRRRRDLNPRAATNDLLPFQGSPFSHLGTSAFMAESHSFKESDIQFAAPDPVLPDSAIQ